MSSVSFLRRGGKTLIGPPILADSYLETTPKLLRCMDTSRMIEVRENGVAKPPNHGIHTAESFLPACSPRASANLARYSSAEDQGHSASVILSPWRRKSSMSW